jgi:hypothetical protein
MTKSIGEWNGPEGRYTHSMQVLARIWKCVHGGYLNRRGIRFGCAFGLITIERVGTERS